MKIALMWSSKAKMHQNLSLFFGDEKPPSFMFYFFSYTTLFFPNALACTCILTFIGEKVK